MLTPEKLIEWAEVAEIPIFGYFHEHAPDHIDAGCAGCQSSRVQRSSRAALAALGLTPASALVLAGLAKALVDEVDDIAHLETLLEVLHPLRQGQERPDDCTGEECLYCHGATVVVARMSARCEEGPALADFAALGKEK